MFARFGRGDDLTGVVGRIAANRDGVDRGVRQQVIEFIVKGDRASVFGAQFCRVEFARRANGGDLRQRHCVNCRYMSAGPSPIPNGRGETVKSAWALPASLPYPLSMGWREGALANS